MILRSYKDTLNEVVRPDKELVKNSYTVANAVKQILTKNYKPCQVGMIAEVEFSIGLPNSKTPCHICPNYDTRRLKCRGWE